MKLMLTKKQAEALKYVLDLSSSDMSFNSYDKLSAKSNVMQTHMRYVDNHGWTLKAKPLNDLSIDDMATALYVGYEVEKDLSDDIMFILKDHFKVYDDNAHRYKIDAAWCSIMGAIQDHQIAKEKSPDDN